MLLSIILPTYNEKENIELMIKSLTEVTKKNNIKAIITVVDDNSPDNTGEIVDKIKITNKIVHIVHRKNKEGLGKAYLSGMNYSLNQKAKKFPPGCGNNISRSLIVDG